MKAWRSSVSKFWSCRWTILNAANWSMTVFNFSLSFTPTADLQKLLLGNSTGKFWSGILITLTKVIKTSSGKDSQTPWRIYMIDLAAHVSKCALSLLYKNILYYKTVLKSFGFFLVLVLFCLALSPTDCFYCSCWFSIYLSPLLYVFSQFLILQYLH